MKRVKNTKDFIEKANKIHDNKYDYSETIYVKSSEKVTIICPIHGEFQQSPNKHLSGQGCKPCGRNRTRIGNEEFVKRSRSIHGKKYDYSKVNYKNIHEPVIIICPIHGEFEQTPHSHIILKHNCPKCGHIMAGYNRTGQKKPEIAKARSRETCLRKYGATTWSASKEGRKKQREIVLESDMLDRMKATCQRRYGHDFWTQSDEGREKLVEIMNEPDMKEKIEQGYKEKYGLHYMQTEEGRNKAKNYIDDERRKKMSDSILEKYGEPYYIFTEEFKEKSEQTCLEKYGVPSFSQTELFLEKTWKTKRKNGTFNTSKPEETFYLLLCDAYGEDDVFRQYKDLERYPFACDFYIKSQDLFIEMNIHWSHGGHFYDKNSKDDNNKLKTWVEKSKNKGSKYYHSAINVWTERDLLKKDTALKNNLNYVVFWDQDLSDARNYLKKQGRL